MVSDAEIRVGDCRDVMAAMAPESVDAIVTDPPYGLRFMGAEWDHGVPGVPFWLAALRVAKPGAHLLAFGGTRTFHRLTCAIEDAGWEIRDVVCWLYGQGFPKSLDVSKAIDKAAGAPRRVIGEQRTNVGMQGGNFANKSATGTVAITEPTTEAARRWDGWGTAIKPSWEPVIVARKPLVGTVAANVLAYGTGAINVDACRIEWRGPEDAAAAAAAAAAAGFADSRASGTVTQSRSIGAESRDGTNRYEPAALVGRWPANVAHDGSDEVLALFPESYAGKPHALGGARRRRMAFQQTAGNGPLGDRGSAARFFFTAKASGSDRGNVTRKAVPLLGLDEERERNLHPTVKPTALMRWLVRLVTPPGGLILDPFAGSGSTGVAARQEGFRFIGVELSPEYAAIAERRLAPLLRQTRAL